jgi:hypothetical protein
MKNKKKDVVEVYFIILNLFYNDIISKTDFN